MASDIFGGLLQGLGNFMPQDDPNIKVLNAANELNRLNDQQTKLYANFGKKILDGSDENGPYRETLLELKQLKIMIAQAEKKRDDANAERDLKERNEQLSLQNRTCPSCGEVNLPDIKFCQSCGTKLVVHNIKKCTLCSAENEFETKFCGECGAKL